MIYLFTLLPLIFLYPLQYSRNITDNLIFWLIITFGTILLPKAVNIFRKSLKEKIVTVNLLYLVALLLSSLTSINIQTSFPLFLLHLSYFVIFVTTPRVLYTYKSKERFMLLMLLAVVTLAGISFINTKIFQYVNTESEGLSFMWVYWGHNHLAALLLFAIPLCLFFIMRIYKNTYLRIIIYVILSFLLYNLLITYSRSATIALSISLLTGIYFLVTRFWQKLGKILKFSSIILIVLVLLSASLLILQKYPTGIESRVFHWQKGVEVFIQKPFLGSGPGTFSQTFEYPQNFNYSKSVHPHNLIIQIISDSGILGLIPGFLLYGLILSRCIFILRNANSEKENLILIPSCLGLFGLLLNELTDFDLQLPAIGLLFWLLAGIIYFSDVGTNINKTRFKDNR